MHITRTSFDVAMPRYQICNWFSTGLHHKVYLPKKMTFYEGKKKNRQLVKGIFIHYVFTFYSSYCKYHKIHLLFFYVRAKGGVQVGLGAELSCHLILSLVICHLRHKTSG